MKEYFSCIAARVTSRPSLSLLLINDHNSTETNSSPSNRGSFGQTLALHLQPTAAHHLQHLHLSPPSHLLYLTHFFQPANPPLTSGTYSRLVSRGEPGGVWTENNSADCLRCEKAGRIRENVVKIGRKGRKQVCEQPPQHFLWELFYCPLVVQRSTPYTNPDTRHSSRSRLQSINWVVT